MSHMSNPDKNLYSYSYILPVLAVKAWLGRAVD